jgi:hypothetical protein
MVMLIYIDVPMIVLGIALQACIMHSFSDVQKITSELCLCG